MIKPRITPFLNLRQMILFAFLVFFQNYSLGNENVGLFKPTGEFLDSMISLETQTIYYVCNYDQVVEDHYVETPRVHFRDTKIEPDKGLKVLIRNITLSSINAKFPFVELKYDSKKFGTRRFELKSEPPYSKHQLAVYLDLTHSLKNKFEYEIYESRNKKLLQKGDFSVEVKEEVLPSATILDDPSFCN